MRLVVDGGGFAPFLHDAVLQMEPGDEKEVTVAPKDAFGECEWQPYVLAPSHQMWGADRSRWFGGVDGKIFRKYEPVIGSVRPSANL